MSVVAAFSGLIHEFVIWRRHTRVEGQHGLIQTILAGEVRLEAVVQEQDEMSLVENGDGSHASKIYNVYIPYYPQENGESVKINDEFLIRNYLCKVVAITWYTEGGYCMITCSVPLRDV